MVRSLAMLFNKIKNETNIPDKMRYKKVTALYKGKGPRMLRDSDRGIFTSTVLNCILQKLLLRDNYEEVDANLSDSNIGARKKKNIRNNIFVMNSVIHDAITNNKAIDISVYDYQKMFDSMNLCVTTNDVYDGDLPQLPPPQHHAYQRGELVRSDGQGGGDTREGG